MLLNNVLTARREEHVSTEVASLSVRVPEAKDPSLAKRWGLRDVENILKCRRISIFMLTWNQHGKPPPEPLSAIIPPDSFDMYVIGTEECERTIEQSFLFRSKRRWEALLCDTLGEGCCMIASTDLIAIHICILVRRELLPFITAVQCGRVATGIGNVIGNKGAVAISLRFGLTDFIFVNAHFPAHQQLVPARNAAFHKINSEMALFPPEKPSSLDSPSSRVGSFVAKVSDAMVNAASSVVASSSPSSNPLAARTYRLAPSSPRSLSASPPVRGALVRGHSVLPYTETYSLPALSLPPLSLPSSTLPFLSPSPVPLSGLIHSSPVPRRPSNAATFRDMSYSPLASPVVPPPTPEAPPPLRRSGSVDSLSGGVNTNNLRVQEATLNLQTAVKRLRMGTNISDRFDRIFWMGDLNYRVNGNRAAVDELLRRFDTIGREVLLANDQLHGERRKGTVFNGFEEGDILFRPTYKFADGSDEYDPSAKRRIPAFTDRILYRDRERHSHSHNHPQGNGHARRKNIKLLRYDSLPEVRTSDHRPVFAIFSVAFETAPKEDDISTDRHGSRMCTIS
eukprot:CAMPEP_0184658458 /NCGR_PEP_ID=MMETSP0308-20130426/25471_1 /TAXON_ID=38269 /ORGANISM="Gloeochaete witrockiana, Strain SAG 46.84" /LENGTH=566 /DNA_ID=CAMNT_0027097447 /DNA_START=81 /DNA_END=1781 /DNA_ORIENTATION=+